MIMSAPWRRILKQCLKEGSIVIGGIDKTVPTPRRDIIRRMHSAGLIVWKAPSSLFEESEWVLTPIGKAEARRE